MDSCPPPAPFTTAGACAFNIANGLPVEADNGAFTSSPGQLTDLDTTDSVLTANYTFGGGHTLTSVTGYYDYAFDLNFDADGMPTSTIHTQQAEGYDQISQEFRIASPTGQTLEYLAGVYFHRGELDYASYVTVFPAGNHPALAAFGAGTIGQGQTYGQIEESQSVFAALTWNIAEQLSITAGVRGTSVSKEYDYDLYYGGLSGSYGPVADNLTDPQNTTASTLYGATPGAHSGSRTDDAWMPSVRVEYDLSDDAMTYASYTRGFKAGGFNSAYTASAAAPFSIANIAFDPEFVDAYEVGLKSEWLDRRVMLNLALFRSDYTDLQVTFNELNASGTGFIGLVRNAAAAVSQGAEIESQWRVTPDFRLSTAVTYLDAYYDDYQDVSLTPLQTIQRAPALAACVLANGAASPVCNPIRFQDVSGEPTQFAPQWSGSVTGDYTAHLGEYDLTTSLTAFMSSKYTFSSTDDARHSQEAYTRLDGRMTLEFPGRSWALDLIGQNLTDEDILTYVTDVPGAAGALFTQYQQPRNFALQLRYDW
jgi:outer membrane receptor protein involved in Fe transport